MVDAHRQVIQFEDTAAVEVTDIYKYRFESCPDYNRVLPCNTSLFKGSNASQVAELVDALETTSGNFPNGSSKGGSNGNAPHTGSNPVLTTAMFGNYADQMKVVDGLERQAKSGGAIGRRCSPYSECKMG